MADPKRMLILRGNSAAAGAYPDEQGNKIEWKFGALHEGATIEYARRRGYVAVVLMAPGQPQSQTSPQAKAALDAFAKDSAIAAFYGFSGGGYNLYHILANLAENKPDALYRIELIVVLGAPKRAKSYFEASYFNAEIRKKNKKWVDATWEVVYGTDPPPKWALPHGVPKDTDRHMFGPEWLLAGMPKD